MSDLIEAIETNKACLPWHGLLSAATSADLQVVRGSDRLCMGPSNIAGCSA